MLQDDTPNAHIQRRMLELLSPSLLLSIIGSRPLKIRAKVLRKWMQKAHLLEDLELQRPTLTLRLPRCSRLALPMEAEALDDTNTVKG